MGIIPRRFKATPRPKHVQGVMNQLEKDYASELEAKKRAGLITDYIYEGIKLKIGKACFYTPDFIVITDLTIELHEVKGHWEDDARVKIKACADKFWWLKFMAITRKGKNKPFEYEFFD